MEASKQDIEAEKMRRQIDYYKELYEKVKPEVNTQLRAHIDSLKRKEKVKAKELKAAEEQVREYKVEGFAFSNN